MIQLPHRGIMDSGQPGHAGRDGQMEQDSNLVSRTQGDTKSQNQDGENPAAKAQDVKMGIGRDMKSPNFFQMSGIPKFGKNWLDNFIPDEEMQNTFMTSEVVRNVVMLQCVYYASVYNDLVLYKHSFINNKFNVTLRGQLANRGTDRNFESSLW